MSLTSAGNGVAHIAVIHDGPVLLTHQQRAAPSNTRIEISRSDNHVCTKQAWYGRLGFYLYIVYSFKSEGLQTVKDSRAHCLSVGSFCKLNQITEHLAAIAYN